MSWQASAHKVEAAIGGLTIAETLRNGTEATGYCPACRAWRPVMLHQLPERLQAMTWRMAVARMRCYVPTCRTRTSMVRITAKGSHICTLRAFNIAER